MTGVLTRGRDPRDAHALREGVRKGGREEKRERERKKDRKLVNQVDPHYLEI